MTKTTWFDVAYPDRCESREHRRSATTPAVGRSRCHITCPFCECETTAYIWSLSGGGKRCNGCGALHDNAGRTHKLKEKPAEAEDVS